jgi:hypothetical protein
MRSTKYDAPPMDPLMNQMVDLWMAPWKSWWEAVGRMQADAGTGTARCPRCHEKKGACRCDTAKNPCPSCDPCKCCVCDADLVLYVRPGERRVVPIQLENDTHRERAIHLELSSWATDQGQKVEIGAQLETQEVKLAPCSERVVRLELNIPGAAAANSTTGANRVPPPALHGCQVAYASLKLDGCRTRPWVIAVAIRGLDCEPHRVDCACCEC